MKVAKRTGKIDPSVPEDEKNGLFVEISLQYDDCDYRLEDELKSIGYFLWAKHELGKDFKNKAQRKYEVFCSGYLYFYEQRLQQYLSDIASKYPQQIDKDCNEKFQKYFKQAGVGDDHKIYFEWCDKGKDNFVRIYMNPDPGNPDPPRPPGPPPPESSE